MVTLSLPNVPRSALSLERSLHELFRAAAARAFGDAAAGFEPTVRPSKHADFQVNGALPFAKLVGRPPREVATAVLEALDDSDGLLGTTEIAGPGFINCTLSDRALGARVAALRDDPALGIPAPTDPSTYVIDYSAPNIAKQMHVGHLRTTIIGDAITRMLDATGHRTVRQNHLGDWGTQFGMLIEHLIDSGDPANAVQALVSDLDALYRESRAKFDSDEAFAQRSRERVVLLQRGDELTLRLWQSLVDTSKVYFREVYDRLGVLLTEADDRGESFYNDQLDETIADLTAKGLTSVSEGALVVYPEGFTGRDGKPFPFIVRKSDGGYGYAATDLATVRYSVDQLGGRHLLYVTDARQSQHFHMVFAIARQAGWIDESIETTHIGYGMVTGPDGKPYKTRSGEVVQLIALLDEAVERARQALTDRSTDLDEEGRERLAHAIGVGAVKWADLKNEHTGNYVFDFDRMLAFNGNTGPYVQYASTRAKSVLRKAGEVDLDDVPVVVAQPAEHQLALHLPEFATALQRAADAYEPHLLCVYLFDLADRFTTFYEQCPIITAEDATTRMSRLALCDATAKVLDRGLSLLGIEAVDRM